MVEVKTNNLDSISDELQSVAKSLGEEHGNEIEWLIGRDDILVVVTKHEDYGDGLFVSEMSKTVVESSEKLLGASWTTGVDEYEDNKSMVISDSPDSPRETTMLYGASIFLSSAQINESMEEKSNFGHGLREQTINVLKDAVEDAGLDVSDEDIESMVGD